MIFVLFVDYGKVLQYLIFSKEKIQMVPKPMLVMHHCQPLMSISQFQKMSITQFQKILMSQFQKMSISQFWKILKQNFEKLILACWSVIPDCVHKYQIIMLINVMKFNQLILRLVHTNLFFQYTENPNEKIILVAFNLLGSN